VTGGAGLTGPGLRRACTESCALRSAPLRRTGRVSATARGHGRRHSRGGASLRACPVWSHRHRAPGPDETSRAASPVPLACSGGPEATRAPQAYLLRYLAPVSHAQLSLPAPASKPRGCWDCAGPQARRNQIRPLSFSRHVTRHVPHHALPRAGPPPGGAAGSRPRHAADTRTGHGPTCSHRPRTASAVRAAAHACTSARCPRAPTTPDQDLAPMARTEVVQGSGPSTSTILSTMRLDRDSEGARLSGRSHPCRWPHHHRLRLPAVQEPGCSSTAHCWTQQPREARPPRRRRIPPQPLRKS
jgi:hypothetical protein